MPNTKQMNMEQMSEAFLTALCACNGFGLTKESPDTDGVDCTVKCKGKVAPDSLDSSVRLDVQLKSTYSKIRERRSDGILTYDLEVQNYNKLVDEERQTPIILVVLQMYEDDRQWTEQTPDYLKITKCAYWVSLKGREASENTGTVTIELPAENLLTRDSLKDLLLKVSKREEL